MSAFYALLVGIAMGALIQRVGASSPSMILKNLRLQNLSIIKFMAITIAVGMLLVYTINLFAPQQLHFDVKPAYVLGVALGGIIFGVGFAVGGYCPGTCVVGIGEGRKDAWFAIAGGITGALTFTLLYNVLFSALIKPLDLGKIRLQDVVHLSPIATAVLVGGIMLAIVAMLPTIRKRSSAA
ncbi:MAG: YeeE/YedE thiosulfate transporter family protein [Gemmatimonadota bacterium]